jgi:hypothetical protein
VKKRAKLSTYGWFSIVIASLLAITTAIYVFPLAHLATTDDWDSKHPALEAAAAAIVDGLIVGIAVFAAAMLLKALVIWSWRAFRSRPG